VYHVIITDNIHAKGRCRQTGGGGGVGGGVMGLFGGGGRRGGGGGGGVVVVGKCAGLGECESWGDRRMLIYSASFCCMFGAMSWQ